MPRGSISANYYFPPNWDPSKGGLNKFHGTHALRERAKKIDQGILVIRFEMPFNVWCDTCQQHIGKGVRYNAEKKCVGNYFTTKIWQFEMKCHMCDGLMTMQTDPKNSDYVCISGVRRKVETWDQEENGTFSMISTEEKDKRENDPFYKLESAGVADEAKRVEELPRVMALKEISDARSDDGNLNRLLRKRFREDKKVALAAEADDDKFKAKYNLDISLAPKSARDSQIAGGVSFTGGRLHSTFSTNKAEKRARIQSQSIFSKPALITNGSRNNNSNISRASSSPLALTVRGKVGGSSADLLPATVTSSLEKVEMDKQRRIEAMKKAHERGINPSLIAASASPARNIVKGEGGGAAAASPAAAAAGAKFVIVSKKNDEANANNNGNALLAALADYDD